MFLTLRHVYLPYSFFAGGCHSVETFGVHATYKPSSWTDATCVACGLRGIDLLDRKLVTAPRYVKSLNAMTSECEKRIRKGTHVLVSETYFEVKKVVLRAE